MNGSITQLGLHRKPVFQNVRPPQSVPILQQGSVLEPFLHVTAVEVLNLSTEIMYLDTTFDGTEVENSDGRRQATAKINCMLCCHSASCGP